MSSNGPSIPIDGNVHVSFPGNNPPATFTLDTGGYFIVVSQCDSNFPGSLTLTAPDGSVVTYSAHAAYNFPVPFTPNGTYTVTSCDISVDQVSIFKPRRGVGSGPPNQSP